MTKRTNNAAFVLVGKAQEEAAKAVSAIASTERQADIAAGAPVMQADVVDARNMAIKGAIDGVMSSKAYAAAREAYYSHPDRPWFGTNVTWYDVTSKDTGALSALLCKAVAQEDKEYKEGLEAAFKVAGNPDYKGAKMRVSRVKQDGREAAAEAAFLATRQAAVDAGMTPPEPPKPEPKTVRSFKVRVRDEIIKLYKAGRTAHVAAGDDALDEREEEIYAALQAFMITINIDPRLVK